MMKLGVDHRRRSAIAVKSQPPQTTPLPLTGGRKGVYRGEKAPCGSGRPYTGVKGSHGRQSMRFSAMAD